jgi:hypothetical protein
VLAASKVFLRQLSSILPTPHLKASSLILVYSYIVLELGLVDLVEGKADQSWLALPREKARLNC